MIKLVINIVFALLLISVIVFDKNKTDKLLALVGLIFPAQGVLSYLLGEGHIATFVCTCLCLPCIVAIAIIGGRRVGKYIKGNRK